MKTCFLFDLDGVIIDSEKKYSEVWSHINDLYPTGFEDLATRIKGTTLGDILDEYYPDAGLRVKVEEMLWELESQMVYDFCDGAEMLLRSLVDAGIRMALVTSSNEVKLAHLWEQKPWLKECFDVVVNGDMVKRGKPDPECYLLAASHLGVHPSDCIVVEDSLQGVRAGRAAGCRVVGVVGTVAADCLEPYCDIVLQSLTFADYSGLCALKRR